MLIIIPPLLILIYHRPTRCAIAVTKQGSSVTNLQFLVHSTKKVEILGSLETLTNLLFQFTILTSILDWGLHFSVGASGKVVAGTLAGEVARKLAGVVACATSWWTSWLSRLTRFWKREHLIGSLDTDKSHVWSLHWVTNPSQCTVRSITLEK
jgi:hypothetical protein